MTQPGDGRRESAVSRSCALRGSGAGGGAVTGPQHHLRRAGEMGAATIDGLQPRWQAEPKKVAEVALSLGEAARENLATVAVGGGNFLDTGEPLSRYDVALSLAGLCGIVDYQPADMTVTVEAGVRLSALADLLAARGQWLPVDPPLPQRHTVGGLIAANLFGPCRVSQGRVRDLLLGVRVARADGSLVKAGGRVVKNVAGYDLPKLYVGSLGSLGVIVEATMKVGPVPEATRHFVVDTPNDLSRAVELGLRVVDERLSPFVLAAYSGGAPVGGSRCGLFLSFAGPARQVSWQVDELLRSLAPTKLTLREASGEDYHSVRDRPLQEAGEVAWRLSLVPRLAGGFAAALAGELRDASHGGSFSVLVLPDSGSIWASARAIESIAQLGEFTVRWRSRARQAGGNLVLSRAPVGLKRLAGVWGQWGAAEKLMRRLKGELDPHGLLAPGRFGEGM